jgi:hypothetical protein
VQQRFEKWFILIDPPRRHSDELAQIADQHLHSREYYYRQSQLPDPVEYVTRKGRMRRIHRPSMWSTGDTASHYVNPNGDGALHCVACDRPLPVSQLTG